MTPNTTQIRKRMDSSQNQLLSILETPQIKHKYSIIESKTNLDISFDQRTNQNYFTPTSILKVKQMMRRSASPSSLMSSPVSVKPTNKQLESTPLQHKLRFSVPEGDSVENARLASTKDTLMLKSLRNTSQTIIEQSVQIEECNANTLLDFENTVTEHFCKTTDQTISKSLKFILIIFKKTLIV